MNIVKTPTGQELVVGITSGQNGDERLLARETLTQSDLLPARDETWLRAMRAGVLGTDLQTLSMHVLPGENRGGGDRVAGYFVELHDAHRSYRRHFPLGSLAPVAQRAAVRLVQQGVLQAADQYTYYLTAVRADSAGDGGESAGDAVSPGALSRDASGMRVRNLSEPLVLDRGRLADYLASSEPMVGVSAPPEEGTEPPMPVFVSDEVWQEGLELARRGGELESAAVWTGRIMRDADSTELFMVLDACIEAEFASEEKLSVTFTGETWSRVRQVLEQRRRRLNRPSERMCGSSHGHNFMPEADSTGKRTCESCHLLQYCTRSTAVVSTADETWHRCVFPGQPWALLLVWGYNAREQSDWRLYGLSNATLQPRGIRRLKS